MKASERLSRYFNLIHRQSSLTTDEYHEMLHLEEALVDDMLDLDKFREEQKNGCN